MIAMAKKLPLNLRKQTRLLLLSMTIISRIRRKDNLNMMPFIYTGREFLFKIKSLINCDQHTFKYYNLIQASIFVYFYRKKQTVCPLRP
jgi:hypothetical protein